MLCLERCNSLGMTFLNFFFGVAKSIIFDGFNLRRVIITQALESIAVLVLQEIDLSLLFFEVMNSGIQLSSHFRNCGGMSLVFTLILFAESLQHLLQSLTLLFGVIQCLLGCFS